MLLLLTALTSVLKPDPLFLVAADSGTFDTTVVRRSDPRPSGAAVDIVDRRSKYP